jgi:hypothetical protein
MKTILSKQILQYTHMRFFVQNVFENSSISFLKKIQDYHEETGLPIEVHIRLKTPRHSPSWLGTMEERLLPHHLHLVRQYLPTTTLRTARETHLRSCYDKYKLQVAFVESAMEQVRNYDPFFLTMDEIHESDMILTSLLSKKQFYEEKIMDPRRKKNELQPIRDFFAQCH